MLYQHNNKRMQGQSFNGISIPLNTVDNTAKTVLAGYYKFYGASLFNYNSGGRNKCNQF